MGEEDVKLASAAADTLANPHNIQFKRQQKQKTAEVNNCIIVNKNCFVHRLTPAGVTYCLVSCE